MQGSVSGPAFSPNPQAIPPAQPGDPNPTREAADVLAIARAVLALRDAGPALARMFTPVDVMLALGIASHLAEVLASNSTPMDLHDAQDALERDVTDGVVLRVSVSLPGNLTVAAP
jgi:hypothetical protein